MTLEELESLCAQVRREGGNDDSLVLYHDEADRGLAPWPYRIIPFGIRMPVCWVPGDQDGYAAGWVPAATGAGALNRYLTQALYLGTRAPK